MRKGRWAVAGRERERRRRCSYLCACARGRLHKGARVAWVLFEMRTLSKAASEKRPDETRKDTSAPGTHVSRREKGGGGAAGEREKRARKMLVHPFPRPSFPPRCLIPSQSSPNEWPLQRFLLYASQFSCRSFLCSLIFIRCWNVDGSPAMLSRNTCNGGRYFF